MHKTAVGYAIGKLLQVMGLALLAPLAVGIYDHILHPKRPFTLDSLLEQPDIVGFAVGITAALLFGTALALVCRSGRERQGIREGYAIVTLSWITLSAVGCIPLLLYFIWAQDLHWWQATTDAYFEIMSGFTTTGATILANIEALPRSLLLLRALTHWLGGMGIITLAIVVFPSLGVSGYQMFRGEVPGPTKDRLQPRLAQTASILWGVYAVLSAAEVVLLMIGGMNLFDAVCHTMATMATGGFSTKNASIAAFDSDFIHWVITVFMFLAGVNFLLHFRVLRGDFRTMTSNREFRFYAGVIAATIVIATLTLWAYGPATEADAATSYRYSEPTPQEFSEHYQLHSNKVDSFYGAFKEAAFQTVAIVTTTGFVTADFDIWPNSLRFLLVLLMFFGGCAGSTGGGMKMIRIMIVSKFARNVLVKLTQPRLVAPIKVGKQVVEEGLVLNILSFVALFVGLFVLVGALMTMFVPDLTTAIACSIATMGNIGPGLAGVGAVEHYGWIPIPGKWILVFSMLLGRLEIFTVLIVLRPSVWRK